MFEPGARPRPRLYFSRARVPAGAGPLWHHIGIYAFRRAALDRFVALPASPLEQRESLEQLRALEAGMRIACTRVAHGPFGVDTPADLARARADAWHDRLVPGPPRRLFRPCLPRRPAGPPDPALRHVRGRDRRGALRRRRAGHAALREQPGRPRAGHPLPAAGQRPAHRGRALPARRALPAGAARRHGRRDPPGALARGGAGPGAPHRAGAGRAGGGGGGHRRLRPAGGRARRAGGRGDRLLAGRRAVRAGRAAHRGGGLEGQHHAVLHRRRACGTRRRWSRPTR